MSSYPRNGVSHDPKLFPNTDYSQNKGVYNDCTNYNFVQNNYFGRAKLDQSRDERLMNGDSVDNIENL